MGKSKRPIFYICLGIFFLFAALGCARLGPEYHRPKIGGEIPSHFINAKANESSNDLDLNWVELFPGLGLEQVISEIKKSNFDVKIAAQRVIETKIQLKEVQADRFPRLDLNAEAQRQKRPIIGIIPGKAFSTRTDTFVLSGAASYEVDLWGRLATSRDAALARVLEAEENRRTVELTVEAEVVSRYVKMGIIKRRMEIALKRIANFKKALGTVKGRYKRGLATQMELRKATSALAQANSVLPELRQELLRTTQELSFLLGRYPKPRPVRQIGPGYINQVPQVPEGLPSILLLRRPDIRGAENMLRALNADIRVAHASRFPRITLTGTYGYSSSELEVLIGPGSKLWSIAAGLLQPIFDAGRLKAAEQAAVERYNRGVAEYSKTVLSAFLEVENALVTRREQLKRRKMVLRYLAEAKAAEKLAQSRYERGLTDYLNLLDSQRTRFEAEDALALVDLAILTNRVALVRALGGGWK